MRFIHRHYFVQHVLRRISGGRRLYKLGDLRSGPDNALASRVVDVCDILVLELSPLPDLDLAAATHDADTHGGEQIVCSVGVQVNTAVEDSRCVLSNGRGDESLATWMIVDEVGHVVDNTGNDDKGLAILRVLDEVIPADNRELLERGSPVELGALLVKLLLQLLNTALFNLVGTEFLQVVGEPDVLPESDGPLGRIILIPLDGISVI